MPKQQKHQRQQADIAREQHPQSDLNGAVHLEDAILVRDDRSDE